MMGIELRIHRVAKPRNRLLQLASVVDSREGEGFRVPIILSCSTLSLHAFKEAHTCPPKGIGACWAITEYFAGRAFHHCHKEKGTEEAETGGKILTPLNKTRYKAVLHVNWHDG